MKPYFAHVLYCCVALLVLSGISTAQGLLGVQPFGSYGGGPFDVVNLGNLNVHFAVPIRHKAGRGVPFAYDLTYDNSIWQTVLSGGNKSWQPVHTAGSFGSYWGWQGLGPVFAPYVSYSVTSSTGNCFNGIQVQFTTWVYSNFVYHDAQGGDHSFVPYSYQYVSSPGGNMCPPNGPEPPTGPYTATSGGYTINLSPQSGGIATGNLTYIDGSTLRPPFLTTTPTSTSPFTTTDRNGNKITQSNAVYTDTLGTTVLTAAGTAPSNTTFTYLAPNQQNAVYTVNYLPHTIQTAFNCSGVQEYPATANTYLIDKITRPDGTFYQFTYEPTSIGSPNTTGRILTVTLPTGGKITYSYGSTNCTDGSVLSLTRQLDSASTHWTYARATAGSDSHWQTTITDPTSAANQTVIDFQVSFYETQRVVHQGSTTGPVVSTTITCYNTPNPTPSTCPTAFFSGGVTEKTVFSYIPDTSSSGIAAKTDTTYLVNFPTQPLEIDTYDFGAKGAGVGSLIRRVNTTYGYFTATAAMLPTIVKIIDGNGNIKAQTTYTYDGSTAITSIGTPQHDPVNGARGNLTTVATQVSGSLTLYRKFSYYDTGTPNTATDAGTTTSGGPNTTTYNYDNTGTAPHTNDCGNSFVTSISEPLSMSRSFTWDCDGGVMTSIKDENLNTATLLYTGTGSPLGTPDPNFWRPFGVQDELSNGTSLTYPSVTASESKMLFNGNASVLDHRTKLDDFGRVIIGGTKQGPSTGSNYDSVQTDYDVAGRIAKIYQPYSAAADTVCSGTCPGTTTTYDALNRPLLLTDGGTGTISYSYNFNDVQQTVGPAPTGEHTKQKQLEYDGLGRLTSVCETTSVSGSGSCGQNNAQTGFLTKYTYDPLGDIIGVTQNAQPGAIATQTRTYTFDMTGRLLSELNPETGTVAITYVYDSWDAACGTYTSAGNLVEKKDGMGNVTCMKYDALHRATDITYPSGPYAASTDQKHFVYDTATVNATTMANAKTRLAEAYTGPSAAKKTDLGFSYSARGEITDVWESTLNSGGYFHVNASYWASGKLDVLNGGTSPLPGLPAITYGASDGSGLDGEGRVTKVSAATGQAPVTTVAYNVAQQVTGITFGSADSDVYQYDGNTGRMLNYTFKMGTGPLTDVGALTWNLNGTLQKLQITDQINTLNSQTCTFGYDDVIRITSASCGSVWSQTFALDPFGNLTKSGSASFQPLYNLAKNQYTSIPGGSTTAYDGNGDLTNDVTHSYTWDADGNMLSTDTSAVTMIYDAMDRMIEQTRSSGHTQIVYGPYGSKLALMNGQALVNAFVKLPGGARAVYSSGGLAYYRHSDHLGSSRLATTTTRTKQYDVAYGPYGEDYNGSGTTPDLAFTDQNQDTVKNSWPTNLYDFMLREYRTGHGRWTSPDPSGLAAVNPSNPQSWNRYAYVLNNPMSLIDPFGDDCYDMGGNSIGADTPGSCAASGGNWWDPNTNTWTVPGQSVTVPETQDLVVQEVAVVNPTSLLAQELLTSGPNPANNGNNNSILTPQQQKALYCVGQAAAAKGVSIALDVAGSIPVFGNLVSGATATIQGLNAGYYGTVALANAGNTLLNPSASGAVSTAATVGLTVGSLALSGSKVIPALGTAVSLVALGYDAIKAVQVYKQCMAGPG